MRDVMNTSTKSLIGTLVAVVIIVGIGTALYTLCGPNSQSTWYVQVDNEHLAEREPDKGVVSSGREALAYTLQAYDDKGNTREITFGVERQLHEDAYLKLEVAPLRGVLSWEEVQLEEIPEKARHALEL